MKTKKICIVGILTAMYCALAMLMKFTIIGNIQIDLGYIVLAVACSFVGGWAGFVGAIGCGLESILFSAYGFSISWFIANLIIGLGCGLVFSKTKNLVIRIVSVIIFTAIAMLGVKTMIECYLYHIPFTVKIIKNTIAFMVDSVAMIIGTFLTTKIKKH